MTPRRTYSLILMTEIAEGMKGKKQFKKV